MDSTLREHWDRVEKVNAAIGDCGELTAGSLAKQLIAMGRDYLVYLDPQRGLIGVGAMDVTHQGKLKGYASIEVKESPFPPETGNTEGGE